jgi:hypothetical protein
VDINSRKNLDPEYEFNITPALSNLEINLVYIAAERNRDIIVRNLRSRNVMSCAVIRHRKEGNPSFFLINPADVRQYSGKCKAYTPHQLADAIKRYRHGER